jgi:hypothetical protein
MLFISRIPREDLGFIYPFFLFLQYSSYFIQQQDRGIFSSSIHIYSSQKETAIAT